MVPFIHVYGKIQSDSTNVKNDPRTYVSVEITGNNDSTLHRVVMF